MIFGRRFQVLVAAAALAAAALSGCSSSKSSPSGPSQSSTGAQSGADASAPQVDRQAGSESPLTVGVICTCSGSFGAQTSAAGKVIQAWAKAANAAGGVSGHHIDLTLDDDAGNPGKAVSAASSLVSSRVDVIVDLSLFDAAWAKSVEAAKIPVVGGLLTDTGDQSPYFYDSGQTNDAINYANVATAKAAGAKKVGELYCVEAPQCAASVGPTVAAGKALGVPVVYRASISATAPNYTAQCLAAKDAGVDAIIVLDEFPQLMHVASDCATQSYSPTFVAEGTGFSTQLLNAPGLKDQYWASFPNLPFAIQDKAVASMNAAVDKYYPGLRDDADSWSQVAAQGWTAGLAIAQAVKNADVTAAAALSSTAVLKGLNAFKGETLQGWSPPLTFTAGQPHRVHCWYTARIQNGVLRMVDGHKLTCENGN